MGKNQLGQATTEIADKFLDYATEFNPECISYGSGTQMSVKLASYASLLRLGNITGITVPEFFSGVGDLPTGSYMTLGQVYTGDTFASVYKSKCVMIWMSNPAATSSRCTFLLGKNTMELKSSLFHQNSHQQQCMQISGSIPNQAPMQLWRCLWFRSY